MKYLWVLYCWWDKTSNLKHLELCEKTLTVFLPQRNGVLWVVEYNVDFCSLRVMSSCGCVINQQDEVPKSGSYIPYLLALCSHNVHYNTFATSWEGSGHMRSLKHYVRRTFVSSQAPKPTTVESTVWRHLTA